KHHDDESIRLQLIEGSTAQLSATTPGGNRGHGSHCAWHRSYLHTVIPSDPHQCNNDYRVDEGFTAAVPLVVLTMSLQV
ncbi:MAG: hypothetical protein VYE46_03845, partial [Cyanobacteriota bacterium]|nr:hypothetical protein [Cyanobacteriota bacterium]